MISAEGLSELLDLSWFLPLNSEQCDDLWVINWQGYGRERCLPNLGYFYSVSLEELRKTTKESSIRIGSVHTEIRTSHLLNTSQTLDPYCSMVKRNAHGILVNVFNTEIEINVPLLWETAFWSHAQTQCRSKTCFPFLVHNKIECSISN
jgi:hypothetical protein